MFCVKCGTQIKDGYKFCPKCGTPAFVEQEEPMGEVKEDVNKTSKKVGNEEATNVMSNAKEKKTTSKQKGEEYTSKAMKKIVPNPLIAKALDIEGVKKKAEEGDDFSIFKQAFRYKMGIGVEKDLEKAEKLYEICGGDVGDYVLLTSNYLLDNILSQNLCINKD